MSEKERAARRDHSRREFLARLVAAGAALPAGGLLAACGPQDATGVAVRGAVETTGPRAQRRKIMDAFYTFQNDYFRGWDRGAREASALLNVEHQRAVDYSNLNTLRAEFENAPALDVDGISVLPNTAAASPSVLGLAQQLGIPVSSNWSNAAWSTPLDIGDRFVSFQAGNDVAGAREVASLLFRRMGGRGKLIHIEGIRGNTASDQRTQGVDQALREFPQVQLVARQPGGFDRIQTAPVIENLLTAHPDVDGVFCQNDDSGVAVATALAARGSRALVVGIDAIAEFLGLVAQGRALASWGHHGGWIGAFSTVRVFDALNGVRLTVPERMMYFGGFVIDTPEAAEAYTQLMYRRQPFPFDYERWSRVLHPEDWDPQNTLVPIEPDEYWGPYPKPEGYELPAAYAQARERGEFEQVTETYRAHNRSDPFRAVRRLCREGGRDIV